MKILQIINNLGAGGAEKLLHDLIPIMNNYKGVQIDLLLLTSENSVYYEELINKGVKISIIKYKNIYNPLNIFEISKHVNKHRYDIIHAHLFPTQYWVSLSKFFYKNKNSKLVFTEHSYNNRRRNKVLFKFIERYIYSKYDLIISITEKTQNNLISWINAENNYKVILNGIDLDKFKNAIPYKKSELIDCLHEEIKLVCMVGRFDVPKDHKTLIEAIELLPSNIHLLLIGEGPLRDRSVEYVKTKNIENRVHFLGFRRDVDRILKSVDVVVLASNWEGLSLSSIEGMASGKPFVASNVPGLEEVVKGYGLVFENGNPRELKDCIQVLLDDDLMYSKVSESCLMRSEMFDIENTARSLLDTYKELIR